MFLKSMNDYEIDESKTDDNDDNEDNEDNE